MMMFVTWACVSSSMSVVLPWRLIWRRSCFVVFVLKACSISSSCRCDGFSALLSRRRVMVPIRKQTKKCLVLPPSLFVCLFPLFFS